MDMDFLFRLLNATGVSGDEGQIAELCGTYLTDRCLIGRDSLGNLFATMGNSCCGNTENISILLEAHIDEIGLQVTYIDDNGYIYVRPCGGVDPVAIIGSFVEIHCRGNWTVRGVVGRKPVHLMKGEEKTQAPAFENIWIDTGMAAGAVRKKVCIGDYVTTVPNAYLLGDGRIASKAIDNRVGVFILTQVAKNIDLAAGRSVTFSFTVQEELGCKGASVGCRGDFDYAMCLDAGFSSDVPDVSPRLVGDVELGCGPIIYRNGDTDPDLFNIVTDVAKQRGIDIQISANYAASGGTDARAIQLSGAGHKTASMAYAVRYMHTPVSMADLGDIENTIKLLCHIINQIGQ